MKIKCAIFILLFAVNFSHAQNLINNPSFEDYINCPLSGISSASDLNNCTTFWNKNNFNLGASYLNSCDTTNPYTGCFPFVSSVPYQQGNFQNTRTGNGMCSIIYYDAVNIARFAINTKLKRKLLNDEVYDLIFFSNAYNHCLYFCHNLQAYFTIGQIPIQTAIGIGITNYDSIPASIDYKVLGYEFNDTANWMEIRGKYHAKGGEDFLTIGNLQNQNIEFTVNQGGYANDTCGLSFKCSIIFLDDVSLTLGIDAGKDTIVCANDTNTIQLKASAGWQHYTWKNANGAIVGNTRAISINSLGTYTVIGTVDSLPNYSKIDTVVVKAYNIATALFAAQAPNDTTVCPQTPITLNIINPNNQLTYLWQYKNKVSTNTSISATDSGTYKLKIYSGNCFKKDSVTVSYYGNQQSLIDSSVYHLNIINNTITANNGFTNYEWRDENNEVIGKAQTLTYQTIIAAKSTIYLSAINADGCLIKDTLQIIYNELPIIIPSPQFIGKGNTFTILNLPTNSSVALYNALGQIVFLQNNYTSSSSLSFGEGMGEASGIYFYKIVLPNNEVLNGKLLLLEK